MIDTNTTASRVNLATSQRVAILRYGYQPVPVSAPWVECESAGKRPLMKNWREICANAYETTIQSWANTQRNCTNTGILTNNVRAVDIDVYDADLAAKLRTLAIEHFSSTPLWRTGQAPKILGVWAAAGDCDKVATAAYRLPNGLTARVEVLATGQQFVAFGDHPDAGTAYVWHDSSPLDVPVCDLESISPDSAKAFITAAAEMIVQAGGVLVKPKAEVTTLATKTVSSVEISDAWAKAALNAEYDAVTNAAAGQRNDTLNMAAFNLGQLVGAEHLKEIDIIEMLTEAALVAGLDEAEILPTIRSGLTKGMTSPRGPKLRDDRKPIGKAQVTKTATVTNIQAGVEDQEDLHPYDLFGDPTLTGVPEMPQACVPDAVEAFARDEGERLGVDPAMIAAGCIVACAAVTDDEWKIQPKQYDTTWTESARLWLGTIAPPSAKKTPALNSIIKPLRKIDHNYAEADEPLHEQYAIDEKIYQEKLKAYTAAKAKNDTIPQPMKPEKPAHRRLVVNDSTVPALTDILADNPAGVICVNDELASWFATLDNRETGAKDRADWLSAYNRGAHVVDRIKRGTVRIPNWSVSLIGTIQPGKLRELSSKMSDDGLMQRFMLIHANASGRGVDRAPNDQTISRYHTLVNVLKGLQPAHRETPIKFSEEAQATRTTLLDIIDVMMSLPDSPEALRYHLGKWDGLFARLCLTYHMIDTADQDRYPSPIISDATANRVLVFMRDLLLPNLMKFYRELFGVSQKLENARWIAGYIMANAKAKVTQRDIYRAYSSKLRDEPRVIVDAMHILDLANWVSPVENRNGRDVTEWTVNPLVHTVFAQRAAEEKTRRDAVKATIAATAKRLNLKVKAA